MTEDPSWTRTVSNLMLASSFRRVEKNYCYDMITTTTSTTALLECGQTRPPLILLGWIEIIKKQ